MNKLLELIIAYAEHIYDETHGKGIYALDAEKAVTNSRYFDDLIYYGERCLEYVKAAQALARAKGFGIIDELNIN